MTRLLRHCLPIVSAGLLLALPAVAQNAPSTPPPGGGMPMQSGAGGQRTPPKPKNLKVLPPDVDIIKVMRGYASALGVECSFCHTAADPVTHRPDRASDANPVKDQARAMIRMTDDINAKYMTLLSKTTPTYSADDSTVTCATCHRGQKHPPAFVPPPRPEGGRPASPSGAAPTGAPPTGPS